MLGRRATTDLEKRLGYRFRRPELFALALTHRSHANERGVEDNYERLEFLGDAVLGLVTAAWLYRRHAGLPEGELSKRKAQLVSRATLAARAEALGLGEALRLGVGEERSGGRQKASLLADALEAVFGAVYVEGGLAPAARVIEPMLEAALDPRPGEDSPLATDAKTHLQELAQARGRELPEYRVAAAEGPDHNRVFTVECWLDGVCAGRGSGGSKKIAEQRAAADALQRQESQAAGAAGAAGEAGADGTDKSATIPRS
jgi:ribonuclease-3